MKGKWVELKKRKCGLDRCQSWRAC